jgi:hypothetical protein
VSLEISTRATLLNIGASVLLAIAAGLVGSRVVLPRIHVPAQESRYSLDADILLLASTGLRNALGDIVWVQTLIDSDLEHYLEKNLGSWMYRRFELIARLDPFFYENYLYGGQYLMVAKDDLVGSRALLSRALEKYPDDMSLNWQMGYLLIFEMGDLDAGYPYFAKVHRSPQRPPMFDSIFSRLSTQTLGLKEAYILTLASWKSQPEKSPLRRRLGQILYSMKAEIDFSCIPQQGRPCQPLDFKGVPYRWSSRGWDTVEHRMRLTLKLRPKKEKGP